jgi:hypothetical protein
MAVSQRSEGVGACAGRRTAVVQVVTVFNNEICDGHAVAHQQAVASLVVEGPVALVAQFQQNPVPPAPPACQPPRCNYSSSSSSSSSLNSTPSPVVDGDVCVCVRMCACVLCN